MSLIINTLIRLIYTIKSITWRVYCVQQLLLNCFSRLILKEVIW